MSARLTRVIVEELRENPDALEELRALVADTAPIGLLLRPDEAAQRLGVSRRTVNRMAVDGRLPAVRVGRGWRFYADRLVVSKPQPATSTVTVPPMRHRRPATTDACDIAATAAAIRGR